MLLRKLRRCESTENRALAPSGEFHASGVKRVFADCGELSQTPRYLAREPAQLDLPSRFARSRRNIGYCRDSPATKNIPRARKAHKKQTLNDEERNPSARSSNPGI